MNDSSLDVVVLGAVGIDTCVFLAGGDLDMTPNPHFQTVPTLEAARALLTFRPLQPADAAAGHPRLIRVHVRDHKLRDVAVPDRTLEVRYGAFVFSQLRTGAEAARHRVTSVSYGHAARELRVAGHAA